MNKHPLMFCTAVFGDNGKYRYSLSREWDTRLDQLCWIMLNPSLAGADRTDPTIRRVIDFSHRWGYGGFVVVNAFALVTPYPWQLLNAKDPVGPFNDEAIIQAVVGRKVICAWGNVFHFPDRISAVMALLEQTRTRAHCLGITKWGHPSHPVRLAASKRLRPFRPRVRRAA